MKPYWEDKEAGLTIYHGDCRAILPLLGERKFEMVCTDPPYGFGRVTNDGKDYLDIVAPALRMAWTQLKASGDMFVFTSTGEVVNVANALGQPLKRLLWMYKPNDCTFPLAGWLLTSEAILWFHKGNKLNFAERKPYKHDTYVHTGVGQEGVEGHPTIKPLAVVGDIVSRCVKGGSVLDPFMGSGTTLVAAYRLGRKAVGIEINQEYCEIAVRRLGQIELQLY